jgi:tetratricopeptide (TPR) repeat protein
LYAAVELLPGTAAEALSRLKDEGLLREVRGDLEFRNELMRAQAYYAVAFPTRQHLHKRVGDLLSERDLNGDPAFALEIAWHYLRGECGDRAIPFAHSSAAAFLAVGAPHEAEEVLRALEHAAPSEPVDRRTRLLLAKSLVDQSKAGPALPIIDDLSVDKGLSLHEYAEVAMLRASAEYSLNREPGAKYCETAKSALAAAKNTGDATLISQALFECARAGTEEGLTELVHAAEAGIQELASTVDIDAMPMAILTKAFCRFFFWDPTASLSYLKRVEQLGSYQANAAHLAFIHSGVGISNFFLCRFEDAYTAFLRALELARKVGDDARVSQIAANLCTVQMNRGLCDQSIKYGEMSIRSGESSSSSTLLITYTNSMDAYILLGQEDAALNCLENARKWLIPERRWKLRCAFFVEAASFALVQRNYALALDLIAQLETITRGREDAVPMPGPYWKLRVFRMAHLGQSSEAQGVLRSFATRLQTTCPFHYLDILAAKAWLEARQDGRLSVQTEEELGVFESIGATGRRALLTCQGFLPPVTSLVAMPELSTNPATSRDRYGLRI